MSEIIKLDAIPSLDEYVPASVDLSSEYWTPEAAGETRRMVFWGVENRVVQSQDEPGKEVELECCIFLQPQPDGGYRTVEQGSKRLVAAFVNNAVAQGTPFEIRYLGKKRNRSNQFQSDHWSIVELAKPKKQGS